MITSAIIGLTQREPIACGSDKSQPDHAHGLTWSALAA